MVLHNANPRIGNKSNRLPACRPWRVAFWICSVTMAAMAAASPAQDSQEKSRLYAGQTLQQWVSRLDSLDPRSPEAVRAVPGLLALINDGTLPGTTRSLFAIRLARLGKAAKPAVPVLTRELVNRTDDPQRNYLWAVRALGLIGPDAEAATDELVRYLFDRSLPLGHRQLAIEPLARIGGRQPEAMRGLLHLWNSPGDDLTPAEVSVMRCLAAEAFAVIGPAAEPAAPLLMRAVRDRRQAAELRRKSVIALGALRYRGQIAVPVLCEALEFDRDESVRDAAATALVQLGPATHSLLNRYLQHRDVAVRWRIVWACRTIKTKPLPREIAQLLLVGIRDSNSVVRLNAAESMWLTTRQRQAVGIAADLCAVREREIRYRAMKLLLSAKPLTANERSKLQRLHAGNPNTAIQRTIDRVLN